MCPPSVFHGLVTIAMHASLHECVLCMHGWIWLVEQWI